MADKTKKHGAETSHEKHVKAGEEGAKARWGHGHEASEETHEKLVEAGKKGAEARWGKEEK